MTLCTKTPRPFTIMEELHIQFEARLAANDNELWPLHQSRPPTPEQIEQVRQRWQDEQDEGEAS